MKLEPQRVVLRSQDLDRIGGHRSRTRDCGQNPPVRAPEAQLPAGLSLHLVTVLVDRAVVAATEQREVRERRGAAVRPVAEVMALTEWQPAAPEAATAVSMLQRAPYRGRNRAGPRADFGDPAIRVVAHHHAARVARQASGRFDGNVRAVLEDGLAGRVRIGQHRGVDVDDDLIALARGAGTDPVMERRLRDERQRVRLLLRHAGRLRGNVGCTPQTSAGNVSAGTFLFIGSVTELAVCAR